VFRCALNFPGRYIKPTTRLARCAINSPCSRYVCLSVSSASASPFYCSILLIARWPVVFSLGRVACCELVLAIARRAAGRFPATLIAPVPRPGPRAGPRATATGARRVYLPRARRAHATSGASGPSVRAARRDRALAGGLRGSALRREDSRLRLSPPPPWRPARVPDGAPPQVGPQRPSYSYCSLRLYPRRRARRRAWTPEPTGLAGFRLYRPQTPHTYTRLHNPLIIYVSSLKPQHSPQPLNVNVNANVR